MSKYTRRPATDDEVCIHAMSRVVQKRFLIEEKGMEEMRRILRTQAAFAGFDVITFCFLKNHFHILLHLDPERARGKVTDAELVRRFRSLYGSKWSPSLGVDAETLEVVLKRNNSRAAEVRRKLKARMGDVSVFMRELKTRFTFWYNKNYHTVGTFWAERFRSVLVEPGSFALKAVAAYVDVNAVRAGLAETPQSYAYCGLGEAERLGQRAREAYVWLIRTAKKRIAGNLSSKEIFADYAAYVNRIVEGIKREKAALAASDSSFDNESTDDGPLMVEEAPAAYGFGTKTAAVGGKDWIKDLLQPGAIFGYLRRGKPKAVTGDNSADESLPGIWRV